MRTERMASTLEVREGEGRGNTANNESGCLRLERSRARMRLMEMIECFRLFPISIFLTWLPLNFVQK